MTPELGRAVILVLHPQLLPRPAGGAHVQQPGVLQQLHTHTHSYKSLSSTNIQSFHQLFDVERWCRSISRSLHSRYSQRWARRSRPESAASRCRSRSEGDTVSASISEASWDAARDWRAWVTWDWPPRGWGDGPLTAGLDQDHCSRSRSHTSLLLRHKHTSWSTRASADRGAQSVIRTSAARPESLRTPPWCCRSPRTSGLPWAAARESSRCSSTCGGERGGVSAWINWVFSFDYRIDEINKYYIFWW